MSSSKTNLEYASGDSSHSKTESSVASVTVIVPVRNEERHIGNTLDQLLAQEREGISAEILVVDGRSTDNTREVVQQYSERYPEVRLLDNPQRLSSSARNVAIEDSTGEYLVVIDGHCEIPSNTYLLDLVDAFERTGADCLGRPQPLDVSDAMTLQLAIACARDSRLGHHPDSFIYSKQEVACPAQSVAIAYRRDVFDRIGMFDPAFDACEDCELNFRIDEAGMSCYLVPKLEVKYLPRNSLKGLFRQLMRYGRGRVRLLRKHFDSFSLTSFVPALFLVGLVVGPIMCWMIPTLWYFYGAVLTIYCTTLLITSTQIAIRQKKPSFLLLLPLVFVCVHLGSGWGAVLEFACSGHSRNS